MCVLSLIRREWVVEVDGGMVMIKKWFYCIIGWFCRQSISMEERVKTGGLFQWSNNTFKDVASGAV